MGHSTDQHAFGIPEVMYATLARLGPTTIEHLGEVSGRDLHLCVADIKILTGCGLVEELGDEQLSVRSPRAPMEALAVGIEEQVRTARQAALRLADIYDAGNRHDEQLVETVRGPREISNVFVSMQETAQTSIRGLVRGPYILDSQHNSPELDALSRGVQIRAVYEPSALALPDLLSFTNLAISAGEAARVFPDLPVKMTLRDHNLALLALPSSDASDQSLALLVRPSVFLDALQELFEAFWRLGVPVPHRALSSEPEEGWRTDAARLCALLVAGLTDEHIARELGVSERTVSRRIARFQEMLAAKNRFQLGVQAVRQGWI